MNTKKYISLVVFGILFVLALPVALYLQVIHRDERTEDQKKEMMREYLKKYPMPKTSIKLKRVASFPDIESMDKSLFLRSAFSLFIDNDRFIYVSDMNGNKIMVFDLSGRLVNHFGVLGQGPADFSRPIDVIVWKDLIVVNDLGNLRVQFLDKNGKYKKSFKTYRTYRQMVMGNDGILYLKKVRVDEDDSFLVDALDTDGKRIFSFGEPIKDNSKNRSALNDVRLTCNQKGEIFMAFKILPIIREYSAKGKLLREINNLKYPVFIDNMAHNKSLLNSNASLMKYKNSILDIWVEGDRIFASRYYAHRLEIIEFNLDGDVKNVFWNDENVEGYISFDFEARKENGKYTFYFAKVYPEAGIDVYKY